MPKKKKKSGPRESRGLINDRGGEKIRPKGIENVYQCPRRRKVQAQGNRENSSTTKKEKKQQSNGNWRDSVKMDLFKSFLRPSAGEIVKDDAESNSKSDAESNLSNHCTDHNTCNDSISDIF